jgi:hypothetical protein
MVYPFVVSLRHHLAIGYSGYLRGPVNLRDPCFFGMCITPVAGLQYAKSRLIIIVKGLSATKLRNIYNEIELTTVLR